MFCVVGSWNSLRLSDGCGGGGIDAEGEGRVSELL